VIRHSAAPWFQTIYKEANLSALGWGQIKLTNALNRLLQELKGKTTTVMQQIELLQQRDQENDALVDYLDARKRFLRVLRWNTDHLSQAVRHADPSPRLDDALPTKLHGLTE
jgi:hypothetical protein